tara:strand:+ start:995 stop:1753 length:759 start_codon:yes stop_codon:yes gene_type:complete
MRTPIKDLRHVSKALPTLKNLIPEESKVDSFLLFAGDLEINLAEANRHVTSHTTEYVIYDFWHTLFEDAGRLVEHVKHFFPFPDEDVFLACQDMFNNFKGSYSRSAMFFLLNRCSDTGTISSGNFDQSNVNPLCVSYLTRFKKNNFDVKLNDNFIESLSQESDADFIFIPAGKFTYSFFQEGMNTGEEKTVFEHEELRDAALQLKKKTIIMYSYHPKIIQLYKKFKTKILIDKYGKITQDKKKATEVLIANF